MTRNFKKAYGVLAELQEKYREVPEVDDLKLAKNSYGLFIKVVLKRDLQPGRRLPKEINGVPIKSELVQPV